MRKCVAIGGMLLAFLLVLPLAQAASPSLVWQKPYGGSSYDLGNAIIKTADGGYAAVGYTKSSASGEQDILVIKVDSWGNREWENRFGGKDSDWGHDIVQTMDGGYAVVGATFTVTKLEDACLIKLKPNGMVEWEKKFGGKLWDYAFSLAHTSDGGYVITGFTGSYGDNDGDLWLIKTDRFGDEEWSKTYPLDKRDIGYSVIQTQDGGYAVAGFTFSKGSGGKDAWLLKTDAWGNLQWDRTHGGSQDDVARNICPTRDNGYLLTGWTSSLGSGGYDIWVVKTDSSGVLEWQKTFGGTDTDQGYWAVQTEDGGYLIVGFTRSFGYGQEDVWIIKIDPLGNEEWNKPFGGPMRDEGRSIVALDNACAITGLTFSFGAGMGDLWVLMAGPKEMLPPQEEETPEIGSGSPPLLDIISIGAGVGAVGGAGAAFVMYRGRAEKKRKVGEFAERLMKTKRSSLAEAMRELKRKKEREKGSPLAEAIEKIQKKKE